MECDPHGHLNHLAKKYFKRICFKAHRDFSAPVHFQLCHAGVLFTCTRQASRLTDCICPVCWLSSILLSTLAQIFVISTSSHPLLTWTPCARLVLRKDRARPKYPPDHYCSISWSVASLALSVITVISETARWWAGRQSGRQTFECRVNLHSIVTPSDTR